MDVPELGLQQKLALDMGCSFNYRKESSGHYRRIFTLTASNTSLESVFTEQLSEVVYTRKLALAPRLESFMNPARRKWTFKWIRILVCQDI